MQLSMIYEHVEMIDNQLPGYSKVAVLCDLGPEALVNFIDRSEIQSYGGWLNDDGSWLWDRVKADHHYIARVMGINRRQSVAFFINVYRELDHATGTLLGKHISISLSDFSGTGDHKYLMNNSLIKGIMDISARRRRAFKTNQSSTASTSTQDTEQVNDFERLFEIEEGRTFIDSGNYISYMPNQKVPIYSNLDPQHVVDCLDRSNNGFGGWLSENGESYIWDRSKLDHKSVSLAMGINIDNSIAFYIIPECKPSLPPRLRFVNGIDYNKLITDVEFKISAFSGSGDIDKLMASEFVAGIIDVLNERKKTVSKLMSGSHRT